MPRYKEPFTIFPRKLKSGKTIYYYRTYTPDGARTVAHSTGKTNKTQARCYCSELLKDGLLYLGGGVSFRLYAKGFFSDSGQWYADKLQAGKGKEQPVARNTLSAYRHNCDDILVPYFGKYKVCDIKPSTIKQFRTTLIQRGLSNSAINQACTCLHIIFTYALADKIIVSDPFVSVGQMYIDARARQTFSREELRKVFCSWNDNSGKKDFSIIAAITGMRISEICAIRKETLFPEYIDIKDQLCKGVLMPVKDGERRKLRICGDIYKILKSRVSESQRFAFPLNQDAYRSAFYAHLDMSAKDRVKEGITFHSLRHFCNTYLLSENIPELKVKSAMGHSSGKGSMTERYANFSIDDFNDLAVAQSKIFRYLFSL